MHHLNSAGISYADPDFIETYKVSTPAGQVQSCVSSGRIFSVDDLIVSCPKEQDHVLYCCVVSGSQCLEHKLLPVTGTSWKHLVEKAVRDAESVMGQEVSLETSFHFPQGLRS